MATLILSCLVIQATCLTIVLAGAIIEAAS
jgi:hypothetical protein